MSYENYKISVIRSSMHSIVDCFIIYSNRSHDLMSQLGVRGRELLPEQTDNLQDCKSSGRSRCFKAGDIR